MSPQKATKPALTKTAGEHPGATVENGWELKKLPEIAEYYIGLTYSPKDISDEGIIVLRSSNIQNDQLDISDTVRVTCPVKKSMHIRKGDILMCSRNGSKRLIGKTALIDNFSEVMTFGAFMTVIRSELNPYLSWFFRSEHFREQISAGGNTAINQITKYILDSITVPIPPLPEQKRIVALLDEAFAGIATAKANAEKNLQNARAVFESHLQSTFTRGGPLVSLSDLADEITDGDHAPPPKAPTGIPFITISDIDKRTGVIDFSNTFMVPEEYFHKLKSNKKPRIGDVLYTVTGATLGIPVLVREQRDFCFQRHIGLIRPNLEVDSSWLTYALRSPQVFHQATSGSTGAAQKTVSLSVLRGLKLPRVSPKEQKLVATKLDTLSAETQRLASIYEKKIAALDELKKALLRQAFSGEL